jgi:hypothetical protein
MEIQILDIGIELLTATSTIGTLPKPYLLHPAVFTPVYDFLPG